MDADGFFPQYKENSDRPRYHDKVLRFRAGSCGLLRGKKFNYKKKQMRCAAPPAD
jgi:hypothetical protein